MKFPKVKHALFCRILIYIVVLISAVVPVIIVVSIKVIPDLIGIIVFFACGIGLIAYLINNLIVLMSLDVTMATLHCYNKVQKQFDLPLKQTVERIEKRISKFGKPYSPTILKPAPINLQYKRSTPFTIYTSGIEKVVATFHVNCLNKDNFIQIINSVKSNSKALMGAKKPHFLDKEQKKSPLNRVTVAVIFADYIDESLRVSLYDTLCKQDKDGFENTFLPCVIDIKRQLCVFDSLRIPYLGFSYPAKNRGIRIIKNLVFGGKFPLAKEEYKIDAHLDINKEQSLWEFWHNLKKDLILNDKENKERFESMYHNQIIFENEFLYIKIEERGVLTATEINEETKTVLIDPIRSWSFPKTSTIASQTISHMEKLIIAYFDDLGYKVEFDTVLD